MNASMSEGAMPLLLGEFPRTLDERFRLSLPLELVGLWGAEPDKLPCVLAKERPGCLSLWHAPVWQTQMESGLRVVESKLQAGRLGHRIAQVQTLGRLLSSRHRPVTLAGRGRLVIPDGFREFLAAEAGSEVMVVGAAVCIEIWERSAWLECLRAEIPQFSSLLDSLSS